MSSNTVSLPDYALLRQRDLMAGMVPFGAATLWRRVKAGKFPAPIKLDDGNITCWRVGEVRAWLESQGARKAA
ncbi:prophage regulatory protein [Rhodanobacter sp. TND4EL1]